MYKLKRQRPERLVKVTNRPTKTKRAGTYDTARAAQVLSLYFEDKLSLGETAKRADVSKQTVYFMIKQAGLSPRSKSEAAKL